MKIISKFKDFYDFEVVKYGVDEKLIYHRETKEFSNFPKGRFKPGRGGEWYHHKILLVGDKTIHLFYGEKKIYSHLELLDLENLKQGRFVNFFHKLYFQYGEPILSFQDGGTLSLIDESGGSSNVFGAKLYEMLDMNRSEMIQYLQNEIFSGLENHLFGDEEERDKLYNEPLMLFEYVDYIRDHEFRGSYRVYKRTYNPNLSQMGIYVDPEFAWQSLVDFLSRKRSDKEIMPEIPNDIKIEEHGFDLKTSFRPKMRKRK